MMRFFTAFFLFTASLAHGQDLTGVWQGHFRNNNIEARQSVFDDRYKFEVQIAQHSKAFQAITYSYLSTVFYGKASAKGTVNPKTNKVILQEGKLLELRMEQGGGACTMTCFLQYSKSGDEEFLEGNFSSMSIKDSSNCGRGVVFLRRVTQSDFYKEPFVAKREAEIEKEKRLEEVAINARPRTTLPKKEPAAPVSRPPARAAVPKKSPPVAVVKPPLRKPGATNPTTRGTRPAAPVKHPPLAKIDVPATGQHPAIDTEGRISKEASPLILPKALISRSNELVRTIVVNTNEVILNIYDDGAIDHDTISVYLDKKQVISHAMLTDRPLVVTLHLDDTNSYHEIVMVAENEGEIPPNTSLMIVKAGDKQYEVRITSTEQKNAMVSFKYEKKQ